MVGGSQGMLLAVVPAGHTAGGEVVSLRVLP